MAPPIKSSDRRSHSSSKDREPEATSSLNLWVGDLSSDTEDADLMEIFRDYGAMDALTSYTPRTYAFVFFRKQEDAKKAKEALQGSIVKGKPIKIQLARPAKPGKCLWIGGISPAVTQEQLEDKLLQFGKLEEYKFLRDRNSALVGYTKLDDAIAAQRDMNGKSIGGEQVRVDFQKPQTQRLPSSRNDWPENHNPRGSGRNIGPQEKYMGYDDARNYHESTHQGSKRHLPHGGRRDGPPSSTLWVGYPPSFHMDEQMLHNAMILFGEIEKIKSFPSRHYSFVEFRSVDEARRAKEGLQGRLFGDPRIQILFSSSDLAPGGKDNAPLLPGYRVPRTDLLFNEPPFGPSYPLAPNSFHGHLLPNGPGPDGNPNAPNWRQSSPASLRPMPNVWDDEFDMREPKRSRFEGSPSNDIRFGLLHPERDIPSQSRGLGRVRGSPDIDIYWRGLIAKAGAPVCCARCVPIGKGLESPLPEVVNCFARTDLDMLEKHYSEAIGFDIVFFVPDSEEEFASYTEFLQYLGLKNRVGVAKCGDGTTLFLVPPSDFLTKVLKVSGPERLYGVVLKLPPQPTIETQQPRATPPPSSRHNVQRQESASHDGYDYIPGNIDPAPRIDHGSDLHENSISRGGAGLVNQSYTLPSAANNYARNSEANNYARNIEADNYAMNPEANNYAMNPEANNFVRNPEASSQVKVSLTPELIATLASLIPSSSQSSTAGSNNISTTSSFPANITSAPVQRRIQENHASFPASQLEPRMNLQQQPQQFRGQYNAEEPFTSQYPSYASLPNGPHNSVQPFLGDEQVQDLAPNMPQRQLDNYASSNGQSLISSNQYYQHDSSFDPYNARGILNQSVQQQAALASSSTQGQTPNVLQNQVVPNAGFSGQMERLQMALNSSGDGSSRGDEEKNQRYQSTLQFAASLLQKIQQQQQGSGQKSPGRPDF
ncbi:uncharacterized protein A4U43_C09F4870 [Asparagus officinalis]|uniref:RRM domain-containing protein n=1 Tax=Asparagus officinalis TaxID=4686 RepID=A0A5P1E5D1_ASPOF|nr:flowering time control protein FPA [Asparagus officinalis]XP_020246407.1 flowering time control protein FPA [Asparagus officinalis]XP_020246408.1 flowering time control protein FPA [Asparagus officinalis]XP_020246409.1 flowering time control protein FPA [Asparagus officinalis]ONK57852.1 uncharacterized protein A4U43_C09F4870 [Asparagus officinalis]